MSGPETLHSLGVRIDGVETRLDELSDQIRRLEVQQGTTNAHLENVAREAAKTSAILEEDFAWRKQEANKAREDAKLRMTHRNKAISELWGTFKQPIANAITLILAAGAAYVAWAYFSIPSTPVDVVEVEIEQVAP